MKLILIIILFPAMCCGQKKDSISKWTNANDASRLHEFTITPKQDTIKCIMLVCDTLTDRPDTGVVFLHHRPPVWWQLGYEVYWVKELGDCGTMANWLPEYLNENKKPLSKSIVVWIIKEIK